MTQPLELLIFDKAEGSTPPQSVVKTLPVQGSLELGRQQSLSEALYTATWDASTRRFRVVVAEGKEQTIGRHHALIDLQPDGRVQITNTSNKSTVHLVENNLAVPQNGAYLVTIPERGVTIRLGSSRTVRLQKKAAPRLPEPPVGPPVGTLGGMTIAPDSSSFMKAAGSRLIAPPIPLPPDPGTNADQLISWLQTTLALLQNAAASLNYLQNACEAVVNLAGMDSGRILMLEKNGWKEEAAYFRGNRPANAENWQPSRRVIDLVRNQRKTFWELPDLNSMGSIVGFQAVVAAPILDQSSEVIGILYADRKHGRPISKVEALLVELLACSVAARKAHDREQQEATMFAQFFSPRLAQQILTRPELLQGRKAEITVLFCDIRGFSKVVHEMPPDVTVRWVSDIIGAMSECVVEKNGVLVDYVGDELMAMWGAPEEQPDHARLACETALKMIEKLNELNDMWQDELKGNPINVGIGISSGQAHVGNVGSKYKFKYGPLGTTVNLGSRVQGATKHLATRLLMTEETFRRLDEPMKARCRRVCTVRVVNIKDPVPLYELATPNQQPWPEWKESYEKALAEFEAGRFRHAARGLQGLITEQVADGPSIVLLARAVNCLAAGNKTPPDHPVWEIPK